MKNQKEGIKKDHQKRRMDLIPIYPLQCMADVLGFGSLKYNDHNWRNGVKWSRTYAAIQRHLTAFWDGEDHDPESKLLHLSHAMCDISFLLEHTKTHQNLDDRWSTIKRSNNAVSNKRTKNLHRLSRK